MKLVTSVRVGQVLTALFLFFVLCLPNNAWAVSDADGDGVMTVTPDTATAGNTGLSFQFNFNQDKSRLLLRSFAQIGSNVQITIPEGWTAPQLTDPDAPGYVSVDLGDGGGLLGFNSCDNYPFGEIAQPSVSGTGPWVINIFQHCLKNDHLLVTYQDVTAPEAGVYEFTAFSRAGFTDDLELDESPEITVSPVCEEGFHASGISCVANNPPFCPDGFTLEEGTCTPDVPEPAFCPDGTTYSSESGLCEGLIPDPTPCPDGLTLNMDTDMCEDATPTLPTCPEGYILSGGTGGGDFCVNSRDPDAPGVPSSCAVEGDTIADGLMCTSPSVPASCDSGTYNADTNMCEVEDPAPSCPDHFEFQVVEGTPMCVFQEFLPSCDDGFHLNEDATACFEDPAPLECAPGFHAVDDACVEDSTPEEGGVFNSTVIVSPSALHGWSLLNYDAESDTDGSATTTAGTGGFFTLGLSIPPIGTGSFEQFVGPNGDEATRLVTSEFNGTSLSSITSLAYDSLVVTNGGAQDTYLQLRIDRNADGEWDDALFFEPVYQTGTYGNLEYSSSFANQCGDNPNCVELNVWQSWNAFAGGWWSNDDSAGGPPLTTLSAYATEYPNAVLATDVPSIRIQAGAGAPVWNNYNGAFDKFVIGIEDGVDTNITTFDFQPDEEGVEEENNDGGGGTTHHPQDRRKSDGEVLGAETGPDSCAPLLTEYMSEGGGSVDQVKALQAFLNGELGINLPITGVFGPLTTQAVRDFQLKYWQDILAPWVPFGLPTDHTTTGNVFKLTEWKINNIHCGAETPAPALP